MNAIEDLCRIKPHPRSKLVDGKDIVRTRWYPAIKKLPVEIWHASMFLGLGYIKRKCNTGDR